MSWVLLNTTSSWTEDIIISLEEPTLPDADQKDGDLAVDGATIGDIGHARFCGSPRQK